MQCLVVLEFPKAKDLAWNKLLSHFSYFKRSLINDLAKEVAVNFSRYGTICYVHLY